MLSLCAVLKHIAQPRFSFECLIKSYSKAGRRKGARTNCANSRDGRNGITLARFAWGGGDPIQQQWEQGGKVSTEDLRLALRRSFFDRFLSI